MSSRTQRVRMSLADVFPLPPNPVSGSHTFTRASTAELATQFQYLVLLRDDCGEDLMGRYYQLYRSSRISAILQRLFLNTDEISVPRQELGNAVDLGD
jgi:hypothetical protein